MYLFGFIFCDVLGKKINEIIFKMVLVVSTLFSPFGDGNLLLVCIEDYMLKCSLNLSDYKLKVMSVASVVFCIPWVLIGDKVVVLEGICWRSVNYDLCQFVNKVY